MGLRSRRAGGPGALRADRRAGRGGARPRRSWRLPPRAGARAQPLVSIVIPTNGTARARSATSRRSLVEQLRAQHRRADRPTRTTRSSSSPTTRHAGPAIVDELDDVGGRPTPRRPLRPALQLLREDQRRRRPQRGRASAAAERRHRGRRPRTGSSGWSCTPRSTGSARSAAGCCSKTAASSTSASASTAASRATPTAASAATSAATPTRSASPATCLAVTGACLMTRRDLFEEVGGLGADLPGQLQRRRLLPEAGRRAAAASSTTPTW